MDELISKRQAIDAVIETTDSWDSVCNICRQKCIENYINSLPFAPGMDCISRRAAIDICANVIDLFRGQFGAGVLVAIKESIEELPSVQPKRGKWVLVCDNNGMHFICNKCGAWRYHQEQKFCGECGADMRGEHDG